MSSVWHRLRATAPDPAVVLIRLMVGAVFLSEGIQKFLFPAALGVGRFAKIGLPSPQVLAPFVGGCEIVLGACVLLGWQIRLAVLPLLAVMVVAFFTTKLPLLHQSGFWVAAHEDRTDFAMILGCLFLLWRGAGAWALDARRP
jgi:putative oxidoreductase